MLECFPKWSHKTYCPKKAWLPFWYFYSFWNKFQRTHTFKFRSEKLRDLKFQLPYDTQFLPFSWHKKCSFQINGRHSHSDENCLREKTISNLLKKVLLHSPYSFFLDWMTKYCSNYNTSKSSTFLLSIEGFTFLRNYYICFECSI